MSKFPMRHDVEFRVNDDGILSNLVCYFNDVSEDYGRECTDIQWCIYKEHLLDTEDIYNSYSGPETKLRDGQVEFKRSEDEMAYTWSYSGPERPQLNPKAQGQTATQEL